MPKETENARELAAARLAYRTRRYLLRNPDVLGFGVGHRFCQGERTGEPALVVYVREGVKSRDPQRVPRHRRIPRHVRLPGRGGSRMLCVDLVETGVGELCQGVTPAVTVCNIGSAVEFGTVGWVARQASGTPVFCSCYHVLLPRAFNPPRTTQTFFHNPAQPQEVTCPSPLFGGSIGNRLGTVMRGERSPTGDLALAEVKAGVSLGSAIQGVGAMGNPPRILQSFKNQPGQGERVRVAVGHDAPIEGRLAEFPASFTVRYPDFPEYTLNNLIMVVTDPVVRPGDSGALLVDDDRRPLGMLIGRDVPSRRSFYMPMSAIMAFNLTPF